MSIEHDEQAVANALASIESTHVLILKGEPVEGCEFDLLPDESDLFDDNTQISQSLLAPVLKLTTGHWFVLHGKEGDGRHFKLTLKDDDSQHLIFVNRNGGNTLHSSFEEFAVLLSSGKATSLPLPGELLKDVRHNLMTSLKQKVKEDQVLELRHKREAAESLAQAIDNTQFILLAVQKSELTDDSGSDITVDREAVIAAQQASEEGTGIIFVDQTGLNIVQPGTDEMVRLVTGASIELEDEIPVGMEDFKQAVSRMHDHPKLAAVTDEG